MFALGPFFCQTVNMPRGDPTTTVAFRLTKNERALLDHALERLDGTRGQRLWWLIEKGVQCLYAGEPYRMRRIKEEICGTELCRKHSQIGFGDCEECEGG